ncbi:MAG: lysine--tRNA ligase [Gammaproteobacteria bacterium]|nr:lysine--tRNA ligase [Gammaproteobacteria bacterium]
MTETSATAADENRLIAERRAKLDALRRVRNPFPNDFRRDNLADTLQREHADDTRERLEQLGKRVKVAGRIMRMRGPFLVISDVSGQIQLYVNRELLPDATRAEIKTWDMGDIVGAEGLLHRSGKGDLYVDMDQARLLTKALRPLPDKYHGLADRELRYRQRYVDLIMNEETRRLFRARSLTLDSLRDYLTDRDFLEVETPAMQSIPGGAAARPFVTYHNALDLEMFLRIAPELYLKRLVVGGFERVFEVARNFRNEGLSTRHNPEFTMLEYYFAYADYRDAMDLTEGMLRAAAERVTGGTLLEYQGEQLDLGKPFVRISVFDSILQFNPSLSAADIDSLERARTTARHLGVEVRPQHGLGKLQMEIFDKTVESRLRQPTFITAYPTEVSPLARRNDENPFISDRFELFIGGRELANGFSELNDPEDQAARFREQVAMKEAGDSEAMHFDADYITALEYGLPPTAGVGIGVDRLVMLLTDAPSIRDVLLFPHLRPQA